MNETKMQIFFKYSDDVAMHSFVLCKDLPNLIRAIVARGGTILEVK